MATTADTSTRQKNALALLTGMLSDWGLESLVPEVQKLLTQGYQDATSITYLLRQTDAYKQRFAGNQERIAQGLAPLSEAQYLATEAGYQQVMQHAGLPAGFYDQPSDFADWIGKNISVDEIKDRADQAQKFVDATDPNMRAALQAYYGVDDKHLAAYFLDQKRAQPIIDRQANAAAIGAAALDQGLDATSRRRAENFADLGVDQARAQQGYQTIGQILPDEANIAHRFGQDYTQADAEDELFGNLASAARKRKQLNQQEQDLFSGSGGSGDSFYHPGYGLAQSGAGQF